VLRRSVPCGHSLRPGSRLSEVGQSEGAARRPVGRGPCGSGRCRGLCATDPSLFGSAPSSTRPRRRREGGADGGRSCVGGRGGCGGAGGGCGFGGIVGHLPLARKLRVRCGRGQVVERRTETMSPAEASGIFFSDRRLPVAFCRRRRRRGEVAILGGGAGGGTGARAAVATSCRAAAPHDAAARGADAAARSAYVAEGSGFLEGQGGGRGGGEARREAGACADERPRRRHAL